MNDCIFCKIIDGTIPSVSVYEDDDIKVFLDISQTTPGHTLLIPKKHIANIFEYDESLAQTILPKIPVIARAIKKSNPQILGLNIVNNNGAIAYQSVFHSHFHFIPRFADTDSFAMTFKDNSEKYSSDELQEIADRIHENLED
ncbi:HIT family protein [Liquorilactobacillus mali]|uniref:Bis(5-nucleosyl)-tetraphosphatase (Asymmetrical) n=1 Tax=Liquorilactobacillus mali TaxID=1618 RepID=A0A0R2GA20_9LACO|nr:HIT family protein [Liquorilactobacillus mali]KRN34220.1 bis(5-nucleosyl)-tetraphosphatase (asymmetrical) [Liquorilactobacillus mali]MDN7144310.1 HIT family protein [Liquorilactobacillus mali]